MKALSIRSYTLAPGTKVMIDKRGAVHLYRRCPKCGALTSDRLRMCVRCHERMEEKR